MADATVSTPLLAQYEGVKARYPGHLVLFRVGDFYETFGDDARLLSKELDVVLTARAPDSQGARTPMAGVPHHAVDTYLGRLVRKGFKVAICDQLEDARLAKGLVRRDVTRVVTPGTVVEDRILGGPDHNFLGAVTLGAGPAEYAVVDITTGEWYHGRAGAAGPDGTVAALAGFQPREVVWRADAVGPDAYVRALRREFPTARIEEAPPPLSEAELPDRLRSSFPTADPLLSADRTLAAFLRATQPRLLPHLSLVASGSPTAHLELDAKTLRHLEIRRPMNPDDPSGPTLLESWDQTVTAPGRRTLSFWLSHPLADLEAIAARQDAVASLAERGATLEELRSGLHSVADLARIATRIAGRRVRPPELAALRAGLAAAARFPGWIREAATTPLLTELAARVDPPAALTDLLQAALPETMPAREDEGGLLREGRSPAVDRARAEERAALDELAALERKEQETTGIKTLKVAYNQVFGYYFEVTRPHLARVPPHFRRRQTVAQAERFTSDELDRLEHRILGSREAAETAEAEAWEGFLREVDAHVPSIHQIARAVGELDALASFAYLAQTRDLVRPTVDDSRTLLIRDGRHPVLERVQGASFVPNDTELGEEEGRLVVLTGPNMSGKSTYMRQVGLLVVLAQAGSFVPARFARIGRVSRLFTRMGFTDEIGRGKSSFMVEMSEVAEILRAADERSLILLDEVGRGTSTFDGLALAWATLRHVHDRTHARCLLATHYHQLTEWVESLPAARNAHLAVEEREDGIVFLHRLIAGSTDRSYGIHVARLAGLPDDVLREAERMLRRLEEEGVAHRPSAPRRRGARYTQGVLLAAPDPGWERLVSDLRTQDLDAMDADEARRRLRQIRDGPSRNPSPPPEGA
jgi:DNA mismatch repair protein MutS